MAVARDGSPVELYALLPERGEGDVVAGAVRRGASILELGCGAGRITRQLVARGFSVVAVDESPEMLAHVRDAEVVCSRIEDLDLRPSLRRCRTRTAIGAGRMRSRCASSRTRRSSRPR